MLKEEKLMMGLWRREGWFGLRGYVLVTGCSIGTEIQRVGY